ncbi:DUF547 domain-containing protein [Congregibacter sp.]|uniref:DUF547 domain-containing protein n=1 Tax=Congregibacter sp. TaxID=2744308 RepID=UPI003F6D0E67
MWLITMDGNKNESPQGLAASGKNSGRPGSRLSRAAVLLVCNIFLILNTSGAAAWDDGGHEPWSELLRSCVQHTADGYSTAVDYDCFSAKEDTLDDYLDALAAVSEDELLNLGEKHQLAFLINAYNAWTVKLILKDWPGVESIRDLGSLLRSPWKKSFIPLLGNTLSLDDIEHGMIREPGRFDDPRIHFAVNCASIGCPALRREAYRGDVLDAQLEEQTRSFIGDPSRNRLRGDELEISSIFKWYRDDFEQGWRDCDTLEQFLARYDDALSLSPQEVIQLGNGDIDIEFLDYDWQLNKTR